MLPASRQQALSRTPVFLGLLVACLAAASVIGSTLANPAYEVALYLAITAGLLASFLSAHGRGNYGILGAIIITSAFTAYILRHTQVFPVTVLYPTVVLAQPDVALAVLIGWLMAGFCFIQTRREHIILCLVSGLAVLGLMATVNLNASMLLAFGIYIFAAIYTLAYDNLLTIQGVCAASRQQVSGLRWSSSQLIPVALLFVVVAGSALGVGRIMYGLSPRLYPGVRPSSWNWAAASVPRLASTADSLWVGGGATHLSDEVVFTVTTDQPALWRSHVYDTYDGHSWHRRHKMSWLLKRRPDGRYEVRDIDSLQGTYATQVFQLYGPDSALIVAAAHPAVIGPITTPTGTMRHVRVLSDSYGTSTGALRMEGVFPPCSTYQVVSIIPDFSVTELRAAGSSYPEQIGERYLDQVPLAVERKLAGLVDEVTADAQTPYDRVSQIFSYLVTNYLYTESPPLTPRHKDSAVYFLLESKRGDCGLFATGMVMMCRMAGIPARPVAGFATGQYDYDLDAYVVRGKDAHAWVEVYFPGLGWVPFNPEANQSFEHQTVASLWRLGHSRLVIGAVVRRGIAVLAVLAVLALLALSAGTFVNLRLLGDWWQHRLTSRRPWNRLDWEWHRFYRGLFRKAGTASQPAHTPQELLELAHRRQLIPAEVTGALQQVTKDLYELRYSPKPASIAQIDKLRRRWANLRKRI